MNNQTVIPLTEVTKLFHRGSEEVRALDHYTLGVENDNGLMGSGTVGMFDYALAVTRGTVATAYKGPTTIGTTAVIQGLRKELITLALVTGKGK